MPRNISDNGLHFTAAWEQFRGTAYRATPAEKYLTIGYGHYGSDVKEGQKITEGQALILLNRDMAAAVKAVDAVAHPSLTQAQFDAVVDLVFNAGAGVIASNTGTGQPNWPCSSTRTGSLCSAFAAVFPGVWPCSTVNRGRKQKRLDALCNSVV